jgi:AcrR family transcriptional regulator
MTDESSGSTQWEQRTVERSLKAARQQAISKGAQFIAAAVELLRTTGKADFTVLEVVEQAGMSLRAFYQHFATKDDLLLALVEVTVHQHAAAARRRVDAAPDPVAKLEALVRSMFGSQESDDPASRGLVIFHWHLADTRSDEFAATIAPYVEIVEDILDEGVAAGTFRSDLPVPSMATLIVHTLVSVLDMRVLGVHVTPDDVTADQMVRWCRSAVTAGTPTSP